MSGTVTLTQAELEQIITAAFVASNTSEANARSVAAALAQAEVDGQKGHGLSRVPSYAAQAKSGKVDGFAVPEVRQTRPGSLIVDAKHGFAYPALDAAIARLPELARSCGVAAAGITRSHHFGVAGRTVERLAEQGMVALVFGNTPQAMAAWGGRRPIFGTNPIAFAAPQRGKPPVVVDLALSQVARGKIMVAAQKGEPIPSGWALDEHGEPTTDAKAALKGTLVPLGGAKGAALALWSRSSPSRSREPTSRSKQRPSSTIKDRPRGWSAAAGHRSGRLRRLRRVPRSLRRSRLRDRARPRRPPSRHPPPSPQGSSRP